MAMRLPKIPLTDAHRGWIGAVIGFIVGPNLGMAVGVLLRACYGFWAREVPLPPWTDQTVLFVFAIIGMIGCTISGGIFAYEYRDSIRRGS